jgi:hypothetical protein
LKHQYAWSNKTKNSQKEISSFHNHWINSQ